MDAKTYHTMDPEHLAEACENLLREYRLRCIWWPEEDAMPAEELASGSLRMAPSRAARRAALRKRLGRSNVSRSRR